MEARRPERRAAVRASAAHQAAAARVGTPEAVVVERFTGTEGLNELFEFTIDTLATSSEFDPFALIGEELSLRLLLANGSFRTWHGYLTAVDALGGDGGLARYRLHLQPWLAALGLRRDSFVYAAKHVQDIVSEVFADHRACGSRGHQSRELKRRPTPSFGDIGNG